MTKSENSSKLRSKFCKIQRKKTLVLFLRGDPGAHIRTEGALSLVHDSQFSRRHAVSLRTKSYVPSFAPDFAELNRCGIRLGNPESHRIPRTSDSTTWRKLMKGKKWEKKRRIHKLLSPIDK